jgi:Rieske Fe-S protein
MNRREFLAVSCASTAAIALVGCGLTGPGGGPPDSVSLTLKVSDYASLAAAGGVAFVTENGGTPLAVVRTGAASFLALSRICPHQGGQINQGGPAFQCTVHGAQFDAHGNWVGGQSTSSMRSYPTSYDPNTDNLVIG